MQDFRVIFLKCRFFFFFFFFWGGGWGLVFRVIFLKCRFFFGGVGFRVIGFWGLGFRVEDYLLRM